jgi:Acetokinase family
MAIILSINAGSSSLKISVYSPGIHLISSCSISSISSPPAKFSCNGKEQKDLDITDHASGFAHFIQYIQQDIDISQITHICHRVVHGGDYTERVIINDESYHHIQSLSDLAPLSIQILFLSSHHHSHSFHFSVTTVLHYPSLDPASQTSQMQLPLPILTPPSTVLSLPTSQTILSTNPSHTNVVSRNMASMVSVVCTFLLSYFPAI